MTTNDALHFLSAHQPLPEDTAMSKDLIEHYDEARRYFLSNPDARCVRLFLGSFGGRNGWGVYQLIEDIVCMYPANVVVPELDVALGSPHRFVRYWTLQIALSFPDRRLVGHFKRVLTTDDADSRLFAAHNLRGVFRASEDVATVVDCLDREQDSDVREALQDLLA